MSTIKQRRTFREAVCEERARTAAGDRAARRARGVILSTGQHRKSKRGDVKRAGASARTSEHDRAIFMSAGPDGSRPRCGGRDSWVGGPGDNPRRSSHVRMTVIDGLDVMPN